MRFKAFLISLLWLMSVQLSPAQVIGSVDFDAIKKAIQDPASPYYYPTLLERWQRQDTTLKLEEVRHLYYGEVFQPGYSGKNFAPGFEKLSEYFAAKDYSNTISQGKIVLTQSPISIYAFMAMEKAYFELKDSVTAQKFHWQWIRIMDVINQSGNGSSCEKAWVITFLYDKELWLGINSIKSQQQPLEVDNCVRYNTTPSEDWNFKEAWFNVAIIDQQSPSNKKGKGKSK